MHGTVEPIHQQQLIKIRKLMLLESFDCDMDSIDTALSNIFCLPIGLAKDEDTKKSPDIL